MPRRIRCIPPKRYSYFDFVEKRVHRIMTKGPDNQKGELILTEHQLHNLLKEYGSQQFCEGYTKAGGTLPFPGSLPSQRT